MKSDVRRAILVCRISAGLCFAVVCLQIVLAIQIGTIRLGAVFVVASCTMAGVLAVRGALKLRRYL